ncbi:MAG TPA: oligosaccharide flippase family protein [bacterium]|nr:oligosaccharide flippase family protein [bacterium]
MNRVTLLALNTVTNYAGFGVSMVVLFVLTPLMIRYAGVEPFGLWTLAYSVVGFLGLLDCGLATSAVKYVAECKSTKDFGRRNRIISTLMLVYIFLAVTALLVIAGLTAVFNTLFSIAPENHSTMTWLLWLIGLRVVVFNLPLSVFRAILFGEQKIYLINIVQTALMIAYGVASYVVLIQGGGVIGVSVVGVISMLIEHGLYAMLSFMVVDHLRFGWSGIDFKEFREVLSFSVYQLIVNVANLVLLRSDPILIKLFMPITAVAVYGVALRIAEYSRQFVKQFINVLSPHISEMHGAGDKEGLRRLLLDGTKIAFSVCIALCVPLWVFSREAIVFWVGESMAGAAPVLLVLTGVTVLTIPQLMASNILAMTGHHVFTAGASVAGIVINIAASVLLIMPLGVIGVALGSLIATVAVDVFIVVNRALKLYRLSLPLYLRQAIFPALVPGAVQMAGSYAMKEILPSDSLLDLIPLVTPGLVGFAIVYWYFSFSQNEKAYYRYKLLSIIKPNKRETKIFKLP